MAWWRGRQERWGLVGTRRALRGANDVGGHHTCTTPAPRLSRNLGESCRGSKVSVVWTVSACMQRKVLLITDPDQWNRDTSLPSGMKIKGKAEGTQRFRLVWLPPGSSFLPINHVVIQPGSPSCPSRSLDRLSIPRALCCVLISSHRTCQ